MASDKLNFEQLLGILGLSDYYPDKLSRDELYQLTIDTFKTDKEDDVPLVWQFIHDITQYNYNARNVENKYVHNNEPRLSGFRKARAKPPTAGKSCIHPLDIIVCVFLCCEPTARQDLALHMWTCRLAVPFILQPRQIRYATVYLWPLRSLTGQILRTNEFVDRPLIHEAMDCIGFIRTGENDAWSKSYLLDCLIWGPDKTHPTFIHRDSEGSKRTRSSVVDGLVEIGWYLPTGETDDRFSGPKVLLNLRGDATIHLDQTKIIGQLSSVTLVLTTMKNLSSSVSIVKSLIEQKSRVIILLADRSIESDSLTKIVEENFSCIPEDDLELLELEQKRLPNILECIHSIINQMEDNGKGKIVMSNSVKNISPMTAYVDENSTPYIEVFDLAKDITSSIRDSGEKSIFPLQKKYWIKWAQISREFHRYHQLDKNEREALQVSSREELNTRMSELRSKQYKHIVDYGIAKPVELFIKAMSNFDSYSSHQKRRIFLRMIKIELDNLSMEKLVPINREYQELINKATSAKADEKAEINKKILDLDSRKTCLSFGLENMFRELGQIYEACIYESRQQTTLSIKDFVLKEYEKLPKYLCFCLEDGYPFELLDGEAGSVPPLWTKAVLLKLASALKDTSVDRKEQTIHVVSVLGIQSSGKSTLINVMFGLQFAVSAGRCSRGAFMQLVRVHNSLSHYVEKSVNYIVVIDTEGLRSPALSSIEYIKHDNELSTLMIGLAHTTVINLMGENVTYLEENLPIVVQAFLRMYLVHLHPRCTIVHQNVDKRNRDKMLQQGLTLQSVLDKLTRKACENEKVPQKTFKDIIDYDVVEHTKYFPSLLEGVLPMAPISPGYSMEASATRNLLIEFLKNDRLTGVSNRYSISKFSNHLFSLWNAIQKDNFIYEFRSTSDVALRLDIDKIYLKTLLELIDDFEWNVSQTLKKMASQKINSEKSISELESVLNTKMKTRQDNIEKFIDSRKHLTPYFPEEWKTYYVEGLKRQYKRLLQEAKTQVQDYPQSVTIQPTLTTQEKKEFRQSCKEKNFEQAFNELKVKKISTINKYDYKSDVIEALNEVCFSYRHLLQLDDIDEHASFSKFEISEDNHINHPFGNFTKTEILTLKETMKTIKRNVEKEYTSAKLTTTERCVIRSYSSRIPAKIMLRVENNLSTDLQSDDVLNGISNQFKIDLLSCVAMTCVRDMKQIYADNKVEILREHLRMKSQQINKREKSMSTAMFQVIEESLRQTFSEQVVFYISDGLHKSKYRTDFASKGMMIRNCISDFINKSCDDIMLEYISYPKHALKRYLSILVETYISGDFLECDLQFYIRSVIDKVWKAFEKISTEYISRKCILDAISQNTDLPVSIKVKASIKINKVLKNDEGINFKLLRENMLYSVETFIKEKQSEFKTLTLKKKGEYVSILSDQLTERLIGCLYRCQICKEICLLSEDHEGSHIFLHRLNDQFDFYHSPEKVCIVWKWLSCNKHDILKRENLQMVRKFHDEWKLITKHEVNADIRERLLQF